MDDASEALGLLGTPHKMGFSMDDQFNIAVAKGWTMTLCSSHVVHASTWLHQILTPTLRDSNYYCCATEKTG